jgi:hypothetical protein
MNVSITRGLAASVAALAALLFTTSALAECRAPAACLACHTAMGYPPAEVIEAIAPASCEVGDFTRGFNLSNPRFIHRTAKLLDGRVLIIGGQAQNQPSSVITTSVDIFDPADNSITPAGPMTVPRWSHAATTLADGRVLVTGGRTASTPAAGVVLATAEIYDPATNTWNETAGPMNVARRSHSSTLLANGKVLIAGGGNSVSTFTQQPIQSAELFDPATGMFTLIGNMITRRSGHSANELDDGTVLLSGGSSGTGTFFPTNASETFDPVSNTFTSTGDMNYSHLAQIPGKLRDGRIVQGSSYYNPTNNSTGGIITDESEIYDPATRTWTPIDPMIKKRIDIGAQGLLDGTLLIAGGVSTKVGPGNLTFFQNTSEVYDPESGGWKLSGIMSTGRDEFSGLRLDDGRVVISGGFVSPGAVLLNSVEIYTPGLSQQIKGLLNVIADLPDSAFQGGHGGRTALIAQIAQVTQKLDANDLPGALDKAGKLLEQRIAQRVADPTAEAQLLSIAQVLVNSLFDRINPNLPPTVAPAASPDSGVEPVSVGFTANAVDPDGTIASVLWNFGDFSSSTELNPTHVYKCDGTYKATLEVADDRGAVTSATVTVTVTSAGGPVSYDCDVQPVFNRVCTGCHGAARGLSLTTCENLQAGASPPPRPAVIPGDAANSRLYQRIISTTNPMPPVGAMLPVSEQNAIRDWINGLDPLDPNFCD